MCSVIYCEKCNKNIDTDYNSEHFDEHEEIETYTDLGTQFNGGKSNEKIKPESISF